MGRGVVWVEEVPVPELPPPGRVAAAASAVPTSGRRDDDQNHGQRERHQRERSEKSGWATSAVIVHLAPGQAIRSIGRADAGASGSGVPSGHPELLRGVGRGRGRIAAALEVSAHDRA